MLIETWVAMVIMFGLCIGGSICSIGWIYESRKLEDERKINHALAEDNKNLASENARLKSKMSIFKLYKDMGGNK